jgi:RHH-type proline utilization regulon transcriptional repressor/proline dehydrogenase/delta 1-pyrroline-5-carboxylate dehydrogenase
MAGIDWNALDAHRYQPEDQAVAGLLAASPLDGAARASVEAEAKALVRAARGLKRRKGVMESFLEEFGLSNAEGLALMCLAEALLRVPDEATADKLIAEKIQNGRWEEHLGGSESWLVNAGTWGLMLTGRVIGLSHDMRSDVSGFMKRFVARAGEPVVRAGAMQAMRILGEQFVLGRTIDTALKRGAAFVRQGEANFFSFDMLGEGARTIADAARYFESYAAAIDTVGKNGGPSPEHCSGVSVKLSALHPRYDIRHWDELLQALYPRVLQLAQRAKAGNIHLCLDAEETDRLVLSLQMLEKLCGEPSLEGWGGLGLAMQAYQKRAPAAVKAVIDLARRRKRRLMVRLVKGAYWDGEVKRAQVGGRSDYPVFTTKPATDVSYLVCADALLAAHDCIYPQFATHNAHTAVAIAHMAKARGVTAYEYQRLHGMGEALYAAGKFAAPVRVYAPVGGHEDLLPYLVRRLLENGANTSFVHSFLDDDVSPDLVAADPISRVEAQPTRHPRLPAPPLLFGASRRNSTGRDLSIARDRAALADVCSVWLDDGGGLISSIVSGTPSKFTGASRPIVSPATGETIATCVDASPEVVAAAVDASVRAQPAWNARGGFERGRILRACADQLEAASDLFIVMLAHEAGRTLQDGVDEVREAVDFLRYYAAEAEKHFGQPQKLPGPAGETNHLELMGRGVFACISPWNFPLAIFAGQIAAALAAGNAVVAKPAEQTPIVAWDMSHMMHKAGVPTDILHLLIGAGDVGAALVAHPKIAGVAFTGSTEVAQKINRTLAAKDGPIPVLIAETGGLNAMFVDTTALKEQVVDDAILSAFGSVGQRCSALRLMFLPHETADAIIECLKGALDVQVIGDPADPRTDIGPVIDADARAILAAHAEAMRKHAKVHAARDVAGQAGTFFGPMLVELSSLDQISREVFGPILHVLRYDPADIATVGAALAAKGYGLTLGVHSRLDSFAEAVKAAVPAGNVYVNRSMIGAVVGVQPFGGLGLSGTGPKAGGPHYLPRFATERTVSVNITAQGGDPSLLNL